jgi:hypothetical protein
MLDRIAPSGAWVLAPTGVEFTRPPAAPPAFPSLVASLQAIRPTNGAANGLSTVFQAALDDADALVEWTEEDVVLLHWRLLQEISALADPATPLEEKIDTLRWVFTEPEKDTKPFSFVSCLRVVGCSPMSPVPYVGAVDPEAVRDYIRSASRRWLRDTLLSYPLWVRDAVVAHPEWVEGRLARNPQWINEEVRRVAVEGDFFA